MQLSPVAASQIKAGIFDTFVDILSSWAKSAWEQFAQSGKKPNPLKTNAFARLTAATSADLAAAVVAGFGKVEVLPDEEKLAALRQNVYVFSGFKTYKTLRQATDLLVDKDGLPRSFEAFLKEVLNVNEAYNKNYLAAEYNTALGQAQMARIWQEAVRAKDDYDLLFDAVGDARTRASHAALDGIIRPVDDAFWDVFMPLLDWNCRCSVRLVPKGTRQTNTLTNEEIEELYVPTVPQMFRVNTAKAGVVFPETHPYFEQNEKHRAAILRALAA